MAHVRRRTAKLRPCASQAERSRREEELERLVDRFKVDKGRPLIRRYAESGSTDLQIDERLEVVEWIVECSHALDLDQETICTAVMNFDRFMSTVASLSKNRTQLVATTCMLVSAKLVETEVPTLAILEECTAGSCTQDAIRACELRFVMPQLDWNARCVLGHEIVHHLFIAFPLEHDQAHLLPDIISQALGYFGTVHTDYAFVTRYSQSTMGLACALLGLNAVHLLPHLWTSAVFAALEGCISVADVLKCKDRTEQHWQQSQSELEPQAFTPCKPAKLGPPRMRTPVQPATPRTPLPAPDFDEPAAPVDVIAISDLAPQAQPQEIDMECRESMMDDDDDDDVQSLSWDDDRPPLRPHRRKRSRHS